MHTYCPKTAEQEKAEKLEREKMEAEFLRLSADFERKKLEDLEVQSYS